ncbi:MAG: hypothetical protein ACLQGP_15625 [Isosphaeraceae bacterium]
MKGVHDMLPLGIARSVWMALVADAMAAVRVEGDAAGPEWPEAAWQAEVLRRVLRRVSSRKSDRELLELAATDWRTHPGAAAFWARAEAAVGDLIRADETLRRLIEEEREDLTP